MTNEEAKALFEEDLKGGKCSEECPECNARELAIIALERQIPKKPDIEGDGYDDNGNIIYDTWICPCCEEHYEVDYDNYKYCPNCGQAIRTEE